ncbi:phenylalanine--tRNA ligase beta subunit-related protein [Pelagibius sp.]|uniref:B3/B4 domain-containing protein n=1 Tax=Pelagibius sp. TaxID=1931238 RepID=UPI002AC339A0|nr:phenylalanine--tRNA ligase beta subunit-related protein [Pelagibius sp.]
MTLDHVHDQAEVSEDVARFSGLAAQRLERASEGEFPEIRAWRRAYSAMGLKPTQYRCAAEALLRRFRKDGSLPRIHPLVDLCNAVSMASATPIAVFDRDRISGDLTVRQAVGSETYLTFGGDTEHPDPDEVIFADAAGHAHARRWANRQSRLSAVSAETVRAIIVAESLHDTAEEDMDRLVTTLSNALSNAFETEPQTAFLLDPAAAFLQPSEAQ